MMIGSSIFGLKDGIRPWLELGLAAPLCALVFLYTSLHPSPRIRKVSLNKAKAGAKPANVLSWPECSLPLHETHIEPTHAHSAGKGKRKQIVTR